MKLVLYFLWPPKYSIWYLTIQILFTLLQSVFNQMMVSLDHQEDQLVLVHPLDLDLRVLHAFQIILEVQVVHHVLPYQVDLAVVVVEVVVVVVGVGAVVVVLNNTLLNKMARTKMNIHNHTDWLPSCNLQILNKINFKQWRDGDFYIHAKISHLVTNLPTSCQQVMFALLVPSRRQVWNKLLTTCNSLDIIRLILQGCSNKSYTVMI